MQFRKDINGLRAFAVISVVLFHFFPSLIPGGFIGVDVFFVISGYLMTSIIFNGINANSFTLIGFYLARARRIVPALAFLCLALLIWGWFLFLPTDFKELSKHAASSITFLSNVIYWRESGYFTPGSHEKWLLHTWSLSVEWQFYIFYPLLILALKRYFNLKTISLILLVTSFILFLLSAFSSYQWPDLAYFMFPTRAWEMLAGGLVYLHPIRMSLFQKIYTERVGLVLLLTGLILVTEKTAWPGLMAMFPVFGTALILVSSRENSVFTSNFAMQWIGKISYSVYLWHWPIVVQLSYMGLSENITYGILGILGSVILGFVSYSLIEQKFSRLVPINTIPKTFLFTIPLAAIASVIFYFDGAITSIRPVSISPQAQFIADYKLKHESLAEAYWLKCNAYVSITDNGNTGIDSSCITKTQDTGLFLWGDSHAEALSLGLRSYLPSNVDFYQVTSAGCKPSFAQSEMQGDFKRACDASNALAINKIRELMPKIVVVAQANNHQLVNWSSFYDELKNLGVEHVILIGPLPQWLPSLPSVIAKRHWPLTENSITDSSLDKSIVLTNDYLRSHLKNEGIIFIDVFSQLCKLTDTGYSCLVKMDDDSLTAVDYGHLSKSGSKFVVSTIIQPALMKYY